MKKRKNISIDQAANEALQHYEAPFMDADWTKMQALLDEPRKPWIILFLSSFINSKHLKTTIIMTTLFSITAIGIYALSTFSTNAVYSSRTTKSILPEAVWETPEQASKSPNETESAALLYNELESANNKNKAQTKPANKAEIPQKDGGVILGNETTMPQTIADAPSKTLSVDSPPVQTKPKRVIKTLEKEVWVAPQYENVRIKHTGDISDFWIGMHYTQEGLNIPDSFDAKTHGFNLQFMGGNLIAKTPFALYGGIDWGMQFRGRSDRKEVILNTVNEDIGYTFLGSVSNDILLRGHIEYPKFFIVPYATFFAGPRIYGTGQTVGMHNPPVDVESSTRSSVKTTALMTMGGGVGARIRLTDYASLDVRYEQIVGETKSVVDLSNSRLAGTAYSLYLKEQETDFGQFKIGVVFDLSASDYEQRLVKEGYTKTVTETYYIDPEDAEKIIIRNPCPQTTRTRYEGEDDYSYPNIRIPSGGNGSGSNPSGGGGKSKTPSIKAPVIRH